MSRGSRIVSSMACALVLSSVLGCATFHSPFAKRMPKATATDPVVEIICLWQPGEGSDPEGVPCKGFMGQIMFLARSSSTPVQIEGDIRIYLFDDQGTPEEQTKPLRQFDFDNGSWAIHLSDSSFGPTYSVFVPYVRRGVTSADCSLRVRLKPKQGPTVFSEFTTMPLNGHKKAMRGDEAKPMNQEENDRMAAEAMSNDLRRTTTISLGPNPKTTDVTTVAKEVIANAKKETATNPIQQASHETVEDSPKNAAEAERIRRMELMIQQLLLQQQVPEADVPTASNRRQPLVDRSNFEDEQTDAGKSSDRLKLKRSAQAILEDDDEVETVRKPPRRASPKRVPTRRRSHPLDDDESSSPSSTSSTEEDDELAQEPSIGDPFDSRLDNAPRYSLQDQRYRRQTR